MFWEWPRTFAKSTRKYLGVFLEKEKKSNSVFELNSFNSDLYLDVLVTCADEPPIQIFEWSH